VGRPRPGGPQAPRHEAALAEGRAIIEGLLHDGPFLLGDALTIADVTAYPFLRYGTAPADPADTDPFHAVLRRHVAVGPQLPRTRDWLARMGALPQA
jgi:glutathione S-transferase